MALLVVARFAPSRHVVHVVFAVATASALVACSSATVGNGSTDGGSGSTEVGPSGAPIEHNAPLGAKCHCGNFEDCCATDLLCVSTESCNVKTATGCYTEGTCSLKQKLGEACSDPRECATPGAVCVGSPSGGGGMCFLSPSATVRCSSSLDCPDGRTCVDSYCKVMNGQTCFEDADCASRFCTAGKCS